MAKIKLQNIFTGITGRLGDYIFKSSASGETIITRVPDMSQVKWSRAQKTNRLCMKEANAYAQEVMNDPEMHAYYQQRASRLGMTAYRMAISDYFKAPEEAEKRKAPGRS